MRTKRKSINCISLLMLFALLSFSGCGDEDTGLTGKALDIYAATSGTETLLVDSAGKTRDGYSLNRKGNVLDADGKMVVRAERLTEYVPAADIVCMDAPEAIEVASDGSGGYYPAECAVEVRVYPADATARKISVSSSSGCIVPVGDDGEPSDSCSLDINGTASLRLKAVRPGAAEITLKSVDGRITSSLDVSSVRMNEADAENIRNEKQKEAKTEAEAETPKPESRPQDTVTDSDGKTVDAPEAGYAPVIREQPEDEICTTDKSANFRVRADDTDAYKWIFINAGGNQIFDGEQAKEAFGSSISGYDKDVLIILDPKVSMDGWKVQCIASNSRYNVYSRIATLRVKQAAEKPTASDQTQTVPQSGGTPAAASDQTQMHVHSFSRTYIKPTATEYGKWRYTCTCGNFYDEPNSSDPPLQPVEEGHQHRYTDTVVKPTATAAGYTRHTCTCGYYYDDSFTFPTAADTFSCAEAERAGNDALTAYGCTLTSTGNPYAPPFEVSAAAIESSGGQTYLNTLARNAVSDTLAQISNAGDNARNHQYRCVVTCSAGTYTIKVIYN